LQLHRNPKTGEEKVVFSCFNQDQSLDSVDFGNLRTRLLQNGVQEKLTAQWIDQCLRKSGVRDRLPNPIARSIPQAASEAAGQFEGAGIASCSPA